MCSLRTTCFLLLVVVFRWHPIVVVGAVVETDCEKDCFACDVRIRMKMRSSGHLVHVWCTVCLCTYAAGVKRGRGTVEQSTRRADAPPETRVILAPRPRCALVLDRHVQKSAGTTMRSIFLENALAGA